VETDLAKYGITAKLPEVFDDSFVGNYLDCERMAYYQTILGRRSKWAEDYNLVWGKVFHKVAEVWSKTGEVQDVMEIISSNLEEENDDRYGRNQFKMQEAFLAWAKFRVADPIQILRAEQPAVVACLDQACPYSDHGCGLTYGGKLDQIVRWQAMVGPLDFKTTVRDESDPISEFKPSHQMEGYVWLTSHLMGKHCWGVIVERIIANKSKIKVDRFPIPSSKDQIREWVATERITHDEIQRKFVNHANNELHWKQNKHRCAQPYMCRFRDVCLSPQEFEFRYRWLRDNTREDRFDFRKDDKASAPGSPDEITTNTTYVRGG